MSRQAVNESQSRDSWVEWDGYLETHPAGGFMQSSWWADFRVGSGYEYSAIMLRHRGMLFGGAVVYKYSVIDGESFYYIPDGPMLPADESHAHDVFDAIMREIDVQRRGDEHTISHLRIEPRWLRIPSFVESFQPMAELADPYMEPRTSLLIDLRMSDDALLARMKSKGRYNTRLAERHGVSVEVDNSATGLADFLRIYDGMIDRQEISSKPHEYFEGLATQLSQTGKGEFYFAVQRGCRIAAALVIYFGNRATYLFGAFDHRYRHLMAPYRLHFEVMRRARSLGYQWYDLWGVAPLGAVDHPWKRISEFKRKLGGQDIVLTPTLDLVFEPAAYDRYREEVDE